MREVAREWIGQDVRIEREEKKMLTTLTMIITHFQIWSEDQNRSCYFLHCSYLIDFLFFFTQISSFFFHIAFHLCVFNKEFSLIIRVHIVASWWKKKQHSFPKTLMLWSTLSNGISTSEVLSYFLFQKCSIAII